MATITALRRVPGRSRPGTAHDAGVEAAPSSRVAVEVDGEPWLVLEEGDVLRLGLCTGLDVDDSLRRRATRASRTAEATRKAGRLLARRPLARADLEARLAPAAGAEAARAVVGRLEAIGVVDDRALGSALAAERLRRGHGPAAVLAALVGRGVPEHVAGEVVAGLDPDEVLAAARHALGTRTGAAGWQRLASRGFDEEVAEALLGLASDGDVDAAPDAGDGWDEGP